MSASKFAFWRDPKKDAVHDMKLGDLIAMLDGDARPEGHEVAMFLFMPDGEIVTVEPIWGKQIREAPTEAYMLHFWRQAVEAGIESGHTDALATARQICKRNWRITGAVCLSWAILFSLVYPHLVG